MEYTFEQYSKDVAGTAQYPQQGNNLVYPALGCAGEAGELAEKVKKIWRNHGLMGLLKPCTPAGDFDGLQALYDGMLKEAGDVLWYINALATEAGTTLAEIAKMNAEKLADRRARGVINSEGDNR